jgi:NAD(P)-dependent dehydrogenase (short-subunit alcohol dehydrogenase family)
METHYDLDGKVAIVTGGGKGIGRAIALGLAQAGARVVVASRTPAELEAVAEEIKQGGGQALRPRSGQALAVVTDVAVNEQIENLVETTMAQLGRIDILVNNAARSFLRPLLELREDGWDKVFDTNCKAVFLLSRAVARLMIEQGGGRIINVTTVGAERGGRNMAAYHASKAALKMLTMCMAAEWAQYNINVNAVGPGVTRTHFSQPLWGNPDLAERIVSAIPKGRIAEPEEIVGAVLFLASDASNFITGQTIYVDGGFLAD